jgi:hypothetical protein
LNFFRFIDAGEACAAEVERLVRSTCSPNCTGACGFKARVTDGRISTLIQAADYPEDSYNPRGCLRGLSMTDLIYGRDRLKYPLIRTGERGSGQFRRASWDEALDHAAGRLKEITAKYGPEAIAATIQVPGTGYVQKGALVALAGPARWTMHHGYDQNGDLPMFWPMIFGVQSEELESLEWLNARTTMIFGSNVIQSRLPDAHHLLEAKAGAGWWWSIPISAAPPPRPTSGCRSRPIPMPPWHSAWPGSSSNANSTMPIFSATSPISPSSSGRTTASGCWPAKSVRWRRRPGAEPFPNIAASL